MIQLLEEMTAQELNQLRLTTSNLTLLDVRNLWEVKLCQIEGSLHMPLSTLILKTPDLAKDLLIVTYCHHGIRSRSAALVLQKKGFTNVANLKGGIDSWSRHIDPSVPIY